MPICHTSPRGELCLPPSITKVLSCLTDAGYEAYVVGGSVRDFLRGQAPNDYDITTNARPDEIHRALADYRLIDTGIAHGTVTALVDGEPIEVTTYRIDGDYRDSRHPENVSFTDDITADLARRDFTVNAIAYHPVCGFCDPFGGCADIEKRIIRAVGDPRARFSEDALRILRALRFSAVLDFSIDKETATAARELAPLLLRISPERVRAELWKLLAGSVAPRVLSDFLSVFATLLPTWKEALDASPSAPFLARVLGALPMEPVLRFTAFLLPLAGDPDAAQALLRGLRFDNRTRERMGKLLLHLGDPYDGSPAVLRRFLAGLGKTDAPLLLTLRRAMAEAAGASSEELARIAAAEDALAAEIARGDACLSLASLAVRGDDLAALGYPKGPEMGKILASLLSAVIDGEVPNEREALAAYVRRLFPL